MFSRCLIILIILIWNLFDWFSSLLKGNLENTHNLSSDATLLLCSRALLIHLEIQFCIPAWCLGFFPKPWYYPVTVWVHYSVELLCSLLFTLFCLHVVDYSLFLPKYSNLHLAYIFFQTRCPFANIIFILFLSTVGFATAASLLLFGIVKGIVSLQITQWLLKLLGSTGPRWNSTEPHQQLFLNLMEDNE